MNTVILRLRHGDDTDRLAELAWTGGRTRIVAPVDTLRPELERLINEGLSEWVAPRLIHSRE
jgi:hypothetical protein